MSTQRIFTIGYGGRSSSEVIDHLKRAEVQFVVDVRSSPYSRYQSEFSKEPLERLLARNGMKYVFMGEQLGGRPADDDCYTDGKVDYGKCRQKSFFMAGIARLLSACEQGLRVCLICSEGRPKDCHRSKLLGVALEEQGVDVQHLMPGGGVSSQAEVIGALTGGQTALFATDFRSRKTYR